MVRISLVPVLTPLYLYVSTFRSMCAFPNMAVFCSSLTSWCPGMLLTYFLNDFEIVPVAPIITGITFVFTFHMRCISIVRSLYFGIIIIIIIIINGGGGRYSLFLHYTFRLRQAVENFFCTISKLCSISIFLIMYLQATLHTQFPIHICIHHQIKCHFEVLAIIEC